MVQLDMKANVCSVKYSPASAHQLAIGSADHCVHLYDLRKPSEPLHMFSGVSTSHALWTCLPSVLLNRSASTWSTTAY